MTLPRGKLECRSFFAKTSRNQIPIVDLGAVLPRRASGCVGCRRRENIIRITGFEITRLEGSNTACLKGSIIINFKEIAAELKPF